MNIFINEKPADITLDTEKTLGDVMSGIEQWISPSGSRIGRIRVNGKNIAEDALAEAFCLNVADIKKLEVFVSPWRELASEALGVLYNTCVLYEKAPFDERAPISAAWEQSFAARFLISDIPDIYNLARGALSGEGLSPQGLNALIEERLREMADPETETCNAEAQVKAVAARLEELPLDMQTGKDQRAAETIQLFSRICEKLFRIFFIHKSEGLLLGTFTVDGLSVREFLEEFNTAIKDLSSAYESRDTVLAGDIAEYELAPRLVKFFNALKNITKSGSGVLSGP